MTERTDTLRRLSLDTPPSLSAERAVLLTEFYEKECRTPFRPGDAGAVVPAPLPAQDALSSATGELIVGERGPAPKVVPTYPELTCHSVEDLRILNSRPEDLVPRRRRVHPAVRGTVIPYWRGRSMRDLIFAELPAGVARQLRRGHVHGVHGAARARAHGARRQDLLRRACSTSSATSPRRSPRSTSSTIPTRSGKARGAASRSTSPAMR